MVRCIVWPDVLLSAGRVVIAEARLKHLKGIKPSEAALRFAFGGLCTVVAGWIASRFGPAMGGLFLAFPAIFPAGASLIEKHEIAHKQKVGADGEGRGRVLAGVDAIGAAIGSIGLAGFAAVVWKMLPAHGPVTVIALATLAWLIISIVLWLVRKSRLFRRRPDLVSFRLLRR
jgi:hypothetical protein